MNTMTQQAMPSSTAPTVVPMLRVITGAAILPALLLAALFLMWGRGPVIAAFPLFAALMQGAMGLAVFCVAFIAFCRFQVQRDPVSYWTGVAVLTFFTADIFYILTWPGVMPNGQGLIAHFTGTAAWIVTIAQGISGGLLLPAALVRRPMLPALTGWRWLWSVVAWVAGVSVVYLLVIIFEQRLPEMVAATGTFSPLLLFSEIGLVFVFALGAVLSTQRYRQSGDTLPAYVALLQIAWTFAQLLVLIGGKRYDLWWYLARLFVTSGYLTLLFGMLSEYVRLYHGERDRRRLLEVSITERKQAEEALRTIMQSFYVVLSSMYCSVMLVTDEGRVEYANQAFCDYFDLQETPAELVGLSAREMHEKIYKSYLHPDEAFTRIREIVERGQPLHGEEIAMHGGRTCLRDFVPLNIHGKLYGRLWILFDITERKQAEEALQSSLREKEILLKEIHHRVKNNMQVISSLVSLQADTLDNPALCSLFNDLRDQVRTMALVHEKLYQSESLACVDFAEYARSLLNYLWRAHGETATNVRLTLDVQPVSLSVDMAVPCGLILNELASNALKHAFRDRTGGEITVLLQADQAGRICLRVSDNGIGLPAGLDWQQSPSLGLRLVQMLAGQLRGTLDVHTEGGTAITLTFVKH